MAKTITRTSSYRCFYTPKDKQGYPQTADSGVMPFIQLRASDAEHAQRAAHHITGCAVADVERREEVFA